MTKPADGFTKMSELVDALTSAPRDRDTYRELLGKIRFGFDEIAKYCTFEDTFYTRNLVARTDDFELILLCWQPGQATPIHDHAGSDGWMFGVQGTLEEVRYHWKKLEDGCIECTRFEKGELQPTGISYINDDMGIHAIENVGGDRAVSLHLYSPPIDACVYYSEDERCFKTKEMSYHTTNDVR